MSTVVNRGGIWQARYTDAQGKQHRTSTYIPVKGGNGLTAREAKKAAESIAAGLEASIKGAASERIIRTVQMQLETVGIARKISARESGSRSFRNARNSCTRIVKRSRATRRCTSHSVTG